MSLESKIRIHKAFVRPIPTYVAEAKSETTLTKKIDDHYRNEGANNISGSH